MADIKTAYGSSTGITCTMASLASGSARQSTSVDNGTNKFVDALVNVSARTNGTTPSGEKAVYVYAYGSEDGTNYSGEASGSDSAYTMASPTNLILLGRIECPSASTTYKGVFSVASAFGGRLPRKWGLVIQNATGNALDSSEGNHQKTYSGVYYTSV